MYRWLVHIQIQLILGGVSALTVLAEEERPEQGIFKGSFLILYANHVYKHTYIKNNISIFVKQVKAMDHTKRIKTIINKQQGTLLSSDVDEYNIPRTYVAMMVAEGTIERIDRGVYVLPDSLEDWMLILQKKYPNLIYSHETALFLHGLSDRTPFEYSATVPSGYKVVNAIREKAKIYYIKKELHLMGVTEERTPLGNTITVYNVERTMCDVVRSRNRMDLQIVSNALTRSLKKKNVDYALLMGYARKLNVEKLLNMYMEMLT